MIERKLLSRPLPVEIPSLGLSGTTTQLQNCGWEFAAEQDMASMSLRILARHKAANILMLSRLVHYDYFDIRAVPVPVVFDHVASRLTVVVHGKSEAVFFNEFDPIDMTPRYVEVDAHSIDRFKIFAGVQARTKEIFIPEPEVGDLLQLILDKQEPGRQEHYRRELARQREGMVVDSMPCTKIHAQIMSIAS